METTKNIPPLAWRDGGTGVLTTMCIVEGQVDTYLHAMADDSGLVAITVQLGDLPSTAIYTRFVTGGLEGARADAERVLLGLLAVLEGDRA